MKAARVGAELRMLRAELTDARRDLVRARTQAEQLILSNRDLSSLWASASRQAGELLKMSVALRRLSEAGDAASAVRAIEDVAINVVGSEDFVLLACDAGANTYPVGGRGPAFDEARRQAPTLDQLRGSADRIVTLSFGGKVVGALVIRRLLEHRPPLSLADEQVLALVAHFAAAAVVGCSEHPDRPDATAGAAPLRLVRTRVTSPRMSRRDD